MARKRLVDILKKVSGDYDTGMFAWAGGWEHPLLAIAEFPDGKLRTVRLNQQADSFFSWPGRASYKRRTVRCWVENRDGRLFGHYETSALQEVL